jgi:hypothetical protein
MRSFNDQNDPVNIFIGERILECLKKAGWTLEELALKLDMPLRHMQKYVQGNVRIPSTILFKIAEALNLSLSYFYEGYEGLPVLQKETAEVRNKRLLAFNILVATNEISNELLIREVAAELEVKMNLCIIYDGKKLLEFLKSLTELSQPLRPDLILIEKNLLKVGGLDVLREVKKNKDIQDVPIVVISDNSSQSDMLECYKNYASGYIVKSPDIQRFKIQIKNVLEYWSTICLPSM